MYKFITLHHVPWLPACVGPCWQITTVTVPFIVTQNQHGCVCLLFISVPCQIKTAYKTLAPSTQKQRLRCDP